MRIRRVDVDDHELVRDARLRALADSPDAFGSTYEREVAFEPAVWIERLATTTNATFVCEADGGAIGMVTIVREPGADGLGSLVGMWVAAHARGSGVADRLVDEALRCAAELGWTRIQLHVVASNERAARLYTRHGFGRTGRTWPRERDAVIELEMERRVGSG